MRVARALRNILIAMPTPTASAAQASMTGMLIEEPAIVTLAHSVHTEAMSVPMAAGEEQLGQQVVIGRSPKWHVQAIINGIGKSL